MPEDSFRILAAGEIDGFKCRTAIVERLLAYWDAKRGGKRWPLRTDIDPSEIKALLPNVMLADITQVPFRVRYRLVGTQIVHVAHFDFTGRYLDELTFESGDAMDWVGCYRQVVEAGLPGFGVAHWQNLDTAYRWIEFLICPLSADGETITQCISAEDYEPLNPVEFDSIGQASPRH